ncbi:MAG: carbohydrate kinase [Planctomycetaceae bacterium]|nr:carbohydrate kinase [Planctomycetaceae bacterium]
MDHPRTIIGLGEALYDVFPDQMRPGGAPLNLAVHAHQLGNRGVVVSRIGEDALGHQLLDDLRQRDMPTDHVQVDPDRATGTVLVQLDPAGEPTYDIVAHVAWDNLQWDPQMESLAAHADAVCFGSLAQRDGQTRNTIYRFLSSARRAVRLFDVNLRQHYHDRRSLDRSLELATAAKLNQDELNTLAVTFACNGSTDEIAEQLRAQFNLEFLALTRGPDGAAVFTDAQKFESLPVSAAPGGNAVGAGDAAAAALLHGRLRNWDWPRTLTLANTLGAHVAAADGACPELTDTIRYLAG